MRIDIKFVACCSHFVPWAATVLVPTLHGKHIACVAPEKRQNVRAKEEMLYYSESGPKTAPTIVFLHGGGVSGWMWTPQVQVLSSEYHCLVPDLPEHGGSRDMQPFTMVNAADGVAELIRCRAHSGQAHVVGLSLGAQVLVQLLSGNSRLVDHAVVSSALLRPVPGMSLAPPLVRLFDPMKNFHFMIRANMKATHVPTKYFQQFREDTRRQTPSSLRHLLDANASFRLPETLTGVTSPVLVVVGEKEYKVMKESAADLVRVIPNARGYLAQNLPHMWNLERPELYTEMVRAWICEQPLPNGLVPL